MRHGQVGDAAGDKDAKYQADNPITKGKTSNPMGLAEPVGNGGSERSGQHIGEPKGEHLIHSEAIAKVAMTVAQ